MPLYEYICEVCNMEDEYLQKLKDPAPFCPQDNVPMKKKLSITKTRRGAGLYSLDLDKPKIGD